MTEAEYARLRSREDELCKAIRDIDAKATPFGSGVVEDGEEYVTKYLIPAGPLHRALGKVVSTSAARTPREARPEADIGNA